MSKCFRHALLALGLMAMQPDLFGREIPLIAGNLIECIISEPDFSSRTAKVSDPLVCYARPLREFGCSGFPRGTQLAGRLVDYRDPGRFFGKGWIKLEFERLILPTAETTIAAKVIAVDGFKVDREGRIMGRGHPKRDVVGWAIPILWPIKLFTLPRRGPTPTLKEERLVTLRLLDDLRVPCEGFRSGLSEPRWRPLDTSSGIYLGSSHSRDDSKRYGVWRMFDGREVGGRTGTIPTTRTAGEALGLRGETAPPEPNRRETATLRGEDDRLAFHSRDSALVIESGPRTLTISSSWPSKRARQGAAFPQGD